MGYKERNIKVEHVTHNKLFDILASHLSYSGAILTFDTTNCATSFLITFVHFTDLLKC